MSSTVAAKQPADGVDPRLDNVGYDALIVVSFGGPEGMDDVIPFLENVTRGRNVPRERLAEVAHHYELFGGVSPINQQNRELIDLLRAELDAHDIELPIYFGNRNWDPFLTDTLARMREDGIGRALGFFTSAFSSYSGCRQYREDIYRAQTTIGLDAPEVAKLRAFYNHPGFIEANVHRVTEALERLAQPGGGDAHVVFTAHSIPTAMADQCRYADQLAESARLVAEAVGAAAHSVVYQSRSGAPHLPWLEPDVCDHLRDLHAGGVRDVVVSPIGFVSDHLEVLYDLDMEAQQLSRELGLRMERAGTAGTHPAYVAMIRELVQERLDRSRERRAIGRYGPTADVCPNNCCLPGSGRSSPWNGEASDGGVPAGGEHARQHSR